MLDYIEFNVQTVTLLAHHSRPNEATLTVTNLAANDVSLKPPLYVSFDISYYQYVLVSRSKQKQKDKMCLRSQLSRVDDLF